VPDKLPGLKFHDNDHNPEHISNFGPVWGWDTPALEMFNKVAKSLWRKTSRRKDSECYELLKHDLLRTLVSYHQDKQALLSGCYCSEPLISTNEAPLTTIFKCGLTEAKFPLSIDSSGNEFFIYGDINRDKFQKFVVLFESFNLEMKRFLNGQNFLPFNQYQLFQRNRATIIGNKESSLGTVLLHAYSKIEAKGDSNIISKDWFDFV